MRKESHVTEASTERESTKHDARQVPLKVASTPAPNHRPSRRPGVAMRLSTDQNQATESLSNPKGQSREDAVMETLVEGTFREVAWAERDLNGHNAQGADFSAATLTGICALGTNFAGALFEETQLQGAALCGANLTGAILRHANLQNANLMWCNLRSASLFGADLRGANLAWADLREVDLREANLSGAYFNYHTQWPHNFDPQHAAMFELAEPR